MKTTEQKAQEIARLMEAGKGKNISVLNVSALNSWTDYFVIVTVTSSAHWQGLYRDVKEYAQANDLEIMMKRRRLSNGDDWNLIDLGAIVVHLMSEDAHTFYDLEKLWHAGTKVPYALSEQADD
ncbi:MAG: ribosome silencing factor [Treponema sp.]|nr:ribosome silencing factor [Treponema sp.]